MNHKILLIGGFILVMCSALWFFDIISEQAVAIFSAILTLLGLIYSWIENKKSEIKKIALEKTKVAEDIALQRSLKKQIEAEMNVLNKISEIYSKEMKRQVTGIFSTGFGFYQSVYQGLIIIDYSECSNEFKEEFHRFRENLKEIGGDFKKVNSWNPLVAIPKSIKIWINYDEVTSPLRTNFINLNKIIETKINKTESASIHSSNE